MEDFMVHFNNILCHNFGELRAIMANQSIKLQKVENMLKELKKPVKEEDDESKEESDQDAKPADHSALVEESIDPTGNIVKEEKLIDDLQYQKSMPITSTPKPKRSTKNADLDDDLETSPYGKLSFY